VIPLFLKQRENGTVTVTDRRMTRFWITLEQGVHFVIRCVDEMHGGEVFVPKIPSMNIMDLVQALAPGCTVQEIGIRPGEKLHELLLSDDETRHAREMEDKYVIMPLHSWWDREAWAQGQELPADFRYGSDNNTERLTLDGLRALAETL
jgi:UDP-N-acetylglucosamine 4,6-dehydratase